MVLTAVTAQTVHTAATADYKLNIFKYIQHTISIKSLTIEKLEVIIGD